MIAWNASDRHFTVQSKSPRNIVVRLFNYPAWQVLVNGKSVVTEKTETTGLMVIPIAAGESDVRIYFRRTADRSAGIIASLIAVALVVVLWIVTRHSVRQQNSQPSN
jgi:energy-converting hydrogenase Eha subunit F